MNYYFAPVQGHTDAPYRHFHNLRYGGDLIYTTPFIRLEKGEIRKKDVKEATSALNAGLPVVPQIIFKNHEELRALTELLKGLGGGSLRRIDINMGCPFPLQTSRGRGAATVGSAECREAVAAVVEANPDVSFSVKMRLGFDKEEWEPLVETLNSLQLDHIAVHPRTSVDQYTPGSLHPEAFERILSKSRNPVVYNGDLLTPRDVLEAERRWPGLHGIMIGRGALGRPSIFAEVCSLKAGGEEWSHEKRIEEMKAFHRELMRHYAETLIGGDHQVLSKIQPFWEYAEAEIGRKAWKAIKKASGMSRYQTALALI